MYLISKRTGDEPLPMHLLLLADENPSLIHMYLPASELFLLRVNDIVVGEYVLQVRGVDAEIMNIAVEPACQQKGYGKAMIQHAMVYARELGSERLIIRTGNSSIAQIALYQRQGFQLTGVDYDYFIRNYPDEIWENGIRCRHQLSFVFELEPVAQDQVSGQAG